MVDMEEVADARCVRNNLSSQWHEIRESDMVCDLIV